MALIKCSECSASVSDKASSCPHCGAPIAAEQVVTASNLVTTQVTAKKFKMHTLLSVLVIIVGTGMIMVNVGENAGPDANPGPGLLVTLIGIVWFLVTRFRTWWHHG